MTPLSFGLRITTKPPARVTVLYQKALRRKAWDRIERAYQDKVNITCRVLERIKGGLKVDIGVPAFLPASQADMRAHPNLDEIKGQEFPCKIIKVDRKKSNVVVSRKAAMEEELEQRKAELAQTFGGRHGDCRQGQEPHRLWRLR